ISLERAARAPREPRVSRCVVTGFGQPASKGLLRPQDQHADVIACDAERGRDLVVACFLVVGENERDSILLGQSGKRFADLADSFLRQQQAERGRALGGGVQPLDVLVREERRFFRPPAQEVDAIVARDGQDPALERLGRVVAAERPIRAHEHLLRRVLGLAMGSEQLAAKPVHPPVMAHIQLLELGVLRHGPARRTSAPENRATCNRIRVTGAVITLGGGPAGTWSPRSWARRQVQAPFSGPSRQVRSRSTRSAIGGCWSTKNHRARKPCSRWEDQSGSATNSHRVCSTRRLAPRWTKISRMPQSWESPLRRRSCSTATWCKARSPSKRSNPGSTRSSRHGRSELPRGRFFCPRCRSSVYRDATSRFEGSVWMST